MDHHTYAKSGSKKWSVEEKRQLVMKRIAADEIFSKYSPKHAEPWKQFKKYGKIGDFSEIALRKQWLAMVQRYRVQKANIASGTLTKQKIEELNKEWEFFGPIHAYMNQKTADLHSYALKELNKPPINNLAIANVYSREELSPLMLGVLNDHNFCERSSPNGGDISDDAEEPLSTPNNDSNNNEELNRLLAEATARMDREEMDGNDAYNEMEELECGLVMVGNEVSLSNGRYNNLEGSLRSGTASPSPCPSPSPSPPKVVKQKSVTKNVKKAKELSEKEKYYKHRLGFEQRMEQRLMGLCTVVGRLLQHFVPNVDIQPLLDMGENRVQTPTTCDIEGEVEPEIKQEEDDGDGDEDEELGDEKEEGDQDVKEEDEEDVKEEDDEDAEYI